MDSILENFGPKNNFWKYNPQFLSVPLYVKLHKEDKSEGKQLSSNIMWAIAFFVHPASIFKNLDLVERQMLIAGDYIKNKNFNWQSVEQEVETFSLLVLTRPRRSLDLWENKIRERDAFINETPYSLETADSLDKIMKNSADIWKQYKAIRDDVLAEGETVIDKGGSKPSLSDEGRI